MLICDWLSAYRSTISVRWSSLVWARFPPLARLGRIGFKSMVSIIHLSFSSIVSFSDEPHWAGLEHQDGPWLRCFSNQCMEAVNIDADDEHALNDEISLKSYMHTMHPSLD